MPDNTDAGLRDFREILFWPVAIDGLRLGAGKDSGELDRDVFGDTLTRSGIWCELTDLLDRGTTPSPATHYAEFVYFQPYVQRFLYPRGEDRHLADLRVWKRTDISSARVSYYNEAREERNCNVELKIDRVHLYASAKFRVAILAVEVSVDAANAVQVNGGRRDLELSDAQELLDRFRRIFAPYFTNFRPGRCPDSVTWKSQETESVGTEKQEGQDSIRDGFAIADTEAHYAWIRDHGCDPVVSHWRELLLPLIPADEKPGARFCYRVLGDERMALMAYLSFDYPDRLTRPDFVRLAFADDSGKSDEYPAGQAFFDAFEQRYCYDRYWDYREPKRWVPPPSEIKWKTRYLCCGYAFVMVGKNDRKDSNPFFTDSEGGGLAHFRHHYFQLGLIVHFHKAALLTMSDRLSEAIRSFTPGATREYDTFVNQVRGLHTDFLEFTSRFWFRDVTAQIQGEELHDMWSDHLRNRDSYEHVRQTIRDLNDYIDVNESREIALDANVFALFAAVGIPIALVLALYGMDRADAFIALVIEPAIGLPGWALFVLANLAAGIAGVLALRWIRAWQRPSGRSS